jgi:glycosyltransferase involved in cell wall biosynthesis
MEQVSCPRLSDLPRLLLCSFDVIPSPSGSSRRLTEYLKALPDRFNVVVLSAKTPDHSHIEKYQGARLLRVPVGSGDLVSRIQAFERAVRRQLESEDYALAHFTDPFGGYALCELKADYGYRLIYEAQTFPSQELRYTHPQTEGDKRFLAKIRRQELFCLMNVDRVVTGSRTTQSYIQSLGASTDQIRLLRAPVDLGPYTPDVLGAPDGRPMRLMYLGSQNGWQGLPTLVRAFGMALEEGVKAKLTLVGARHPDWQPHLEDLVKELGIQAHVEFQPPVLHDDLFKVLALADVGVIPMDDVDRNRLQGGPLAKVSEYLAAGRPVLAADLPVTRELIPESTALFYPAGDTRALAGAIIELARDVPRRVKMGREARAFAEQELDAGLIRGRLLDLYDELLGKRTAASAPSEVPEPTMTGTPTNRLATIVPPEGRRSSRGKPASEGGKSSGRKSQKAAREELPLVVGQALDSNTVDTLLIKTEPDVRPTEPPVVMGLPLREQEAASTASGEEPPAPTPIVRPQPPLRRDEPKEPPTTIAAAPPGARRATTPQTPTPTVRSPLPPEEPPAHTPIVQMKTLGTGRGSGNTRSEPPPSRPSIPQAPPAPATPPASVAPPSSPAPVPPAPVAPSAPVATPAQVAPPVPPAPPVLVATPAPATPPAPVATPASAAPPVPVAPSAPVTPPASVAPPAPAVPSAPVTPPAPVPPAPVTSPAAAAPPAPAAPVAPPAPATPPTLVAPPAPPAPPAPVATPVPAATPAPVPPAPVASAAPPVRVSPPAPVPPPTPAAPPLPVTAAAPPVSATPPAPVATPPPTPGARITSSHPAVRTPPELPEKLRTPPPIPLNRTPALGTQTPPPLIKQADAPAPRPAPTPPPQLAAEDEAEELSEEEAQEIQDDELHTLPTPPHPIPRAEEPEEISEDEVQEAGEADAVESVDDQLESADDAEEADAAQLDEADADALDEADAQPIEPPQPSTPPVGTVVLEPPDSALDPWFAQLAHGYCPPEGAQFARHTPPTNFPGRETANTEPSQAPPAPSLAHGASRGKSS